MKMLIDAAGLTLLKIMFDTAGVEIYRASDTTDTKITAGANGNDMGSW